MAFLFSIAEALEDRAMDRAKKGLRALLSLIPDTARVSRLSGEVEIPASELKELDLLVVWKSPTAGWPSAERSGRSGSGGGTGEWFEYTVRIGRRELRTRLDSISRIAQIQQGRVALEGANVVLVDDVDAASGPRVVRLLRIDPQVANDDRGYPILEDVWKRSPEIVSFVKR